MYSNFIKFILTATAFSPILLSYWIVNTILNSKNLSFYLHIETFSAFLEGVFQIITTHYLLILFLLIVLLCKILLKKAIKSLPIGSIEVKSIKPADVNFDRLLFSYFLPWIKLATSNDLNLLFLFGFIIFYIVYTILGKNSYHYNLVFRILLGYYNYEIQTKKWILSWKNSVLRHFPWGSIKSQIPKRAAFLNNLL